MNRLDEAVSASKVVGRYGHLLRSELPVKDVHEMLVRKLKDVLKEEHVLEV